VNDLERSVGMYLCGRGMYETMVFWESPPDLAAQPPLVQDFAGIWQRADKIVYSRTLQSVTSAKTLIERAFDPEAIRQLKAKAGADLSVGGAALAAQAIKAGLVDAHLRAIDRQLPDRCDAPTYAAVGRRPQLPLQSRRTAGASQRPPIVGQRLHRSRGPFLA
jgi:dihydrofolate reductase